MENTTNITSTDGGGDEEGGGGTGRYYASDGRFYGDIFSQDQKHLMETLYYITPSLSLIGSMILLYALYSGRVIWKRQKLSPTYLRLMGGFAIMDVLSSLVTVGLGIWALPAGTPFVSEGKAHGTTQILCDVKGFFTGFMLFGLPLYSAFLSLFYLLVVVGKVKENTMAKYFEPMFHLVSWGIPSLISLGMIFLESVNPVPGLVGVCGYQDYPPDCLWTDEIDCIRGNEAFWPLLLLGSLVIVGCFATIITSFGMLLCQVQEVERKIQRYGIGSNSGAELTKKTAIIAIKYISAFFFTNIALTPVIFGPAMEVGGSSFYFIPSLLVCILVPFQGFVNSWIFLASQPDLFQQGNGPLYVSFLPQWMFPKKPNSGKDKKGKKGGGRGSRMNNNDTTTALGDASGSNFQTTRSFNNDSNPSWKEGDDKNDTDGNNNTLPEQSQLHVGTGAIIDQTGQVTQI